MWLSGLLAVCLARWSQKADSESAGRAIGNGFAQTSFGPKILNYARPACLRPFFPFLIFPDGIARSGTAIGRWMLYQTLRFLVLWAALYLDWQTFGNAHVLCVSLLYAMTLKFDYWSNSIELLGAVLVCIGLSWPLSLAGGAILGLGRETLPVLALALTPAGAALGCGAALSQAFLRPFLKRDPKWDQAEIDLEYGKSQLGRNLRIYRDPSALLDFGVYLTIGLLALVSAPLLAATLLIVTFYCARADEPRVLTMLIPYAASEVVRWL